MRDPELRSPQEWAEDLREAASGNGGYVANPIDCRELADRMDDLREALRLLRVTFDGVDDYWAEDVRDGQEFVSARDALLAKYASEEG